MNLNQYNLNLIYPYVTYMAKNLTFKFWHADETGLLRRSADGDGFFFGTQIE